MKKKTKSLQVKLAVINNNDPKAMRWACLF